MLIKILIVIFTLSPSTWAAKDATRREDSQTKFNKKCETSQAPEDRYIVKFKDDLNADMDIRNSGGKSERKLRGSKSHAVRLNSVNHKSLCNHPNVESIEKDHPRYPLAVETIPWGISKIQATDPVFASPSASSGVTVCIIDSGFQASHEDLQDMTSGLLTGSIDPVSGNWYEDTCGHGTHVAGTISALKNGLGVVGVNSNGKLNLHIEKVFNGANCGWSYSSDLVAAVERCLSTVRGTGRKLVINMSLGGSQPTALEQDIFIKAHTEGALVVAAAGNSSGPELNYPAGYDTVISVGAVDVLDQKAYFSQYNSDVELTAPGVDVLSTRPFFEPSSSTDGSLGVGTNQWTVWNITGSARLNVTAPLVNGDLCMTSSPSWSGKIVLCQRGTNSFSEKANNVSASGGVGAIIYNNVADIFFGELTPSTSKIPVVSMSRENGLLALNYINEKATLLNTTTTLVGNAYKTLNGTSMATPHVAGAAALIWSLNLTKSHEQLRSALQSSALDMGDPGRDVNFGFGIVQAKAAHEALALNSPPPILTGPTLSASPTNLSFGPINTGTSQTKTITITNSHSESVGISLVNISSDTLIPFTYNHNCPASIPVGQSCLMTIIFSPKSAQNFSASLTITPSKGNMLFINLTGVSQSALPSFSKSISTLAFGNQSVNNTSIAQTITITNTGGVPLTLPSTWLAFSPTGQFAQTNNCSTSLAVGASCLINVTFKPTTAGAKSSSLSISPTGVASQSVPLTGSGVTATWAISPTTLAFGTIKMNTLSVAKTVTVTNSGTGAISNIGISFTGTALTQFRQTNNCPPLLAAKASCVISVVFSPTSTGSKSAKLSVAPTGLTAKTSSLTGTGN